MTTKREKNSVKKVKHPTKNTLNLYYKPDKTTRPSTIALYVLFVLVLLLGMAKLLIYDPVMYLQEQEEILERKEQQLESDLAYLQDYNEVSSQHARYSYSYLTEEEQICDRLEVLDMLEQTVFRQSVLDSMNVYGNLLQVDFQGLNLQEAAALAREIEQYDFVFFVSVNTATLDPKDGQEQHLTTMIIELLPEANGGIE